MITSFAFNIWVINKSPVADFYSPLSRFWEFLFGAYIAYLLLYCSSSLKIISDRVGSQLSFSGLILIGVGVFFLNKTTLFPGWLAILPTLGAALIILGGPKAWLNRNLLSSRPMVWIGLISYPLYLWHWPVLSFLNISLRDSPSRIIKLAAILVSITLAWLTYRLVEKPIRFKHGPVVLPLFLIMMAIIFFGICVFQNDGFKSRNALKGITLNKEVRDQFMGPLWKYTKNDICLDAYPNKNVKNYAWWFCMKNRDAPPTVILLGNSRANQLYPGFIANKNLDHQTFLSIGVCDFASTEGSKDVGNPCFGERFLDSRRFIEELILNSPTIRWAVINLSDDEGVPSAEYISQLNSRIDFLESNNIQVIIFTPDPRIGFTPKACFSTPLKNSVKNCYFKKEKITQISTNYSFLIESIKSSHPNTFFFNPNDMFCAGENCSYVLQGMPLYRDETHISEFASVKLQDYFTVWARKNKLDLFLSNKPLLKE